MLKRFLKILFVFCFFISFVEAEIINNIEVKGNQRVNTETIIMFSDVSVGQDLSDNDLNQILKKLYETNFFEDVEVKQRNLDGKLVDIDINIKENQTGTFTAGASFGTLEGITLLTGLNENNIAGTG